MLGADAKQTKKNSHFLLDRFFEGTREKSRTHSVVGP